MAPGHTESSQCKVTDAKHGIIGTSSEASSGIYHHMVVVVSQLVTFSGTYQIIMHSET